MTEPTITLDGTPETGTVTITHGGVEGTQRRVAVLDADGVVISTALVPADWADQDPATRWQPDGEVVLLDDGQSVGPGWRRDGDHWTEPDPEPEPAATAAAAPASADGLVALVDALRALTPDQAEQLQQLLAAPSGG